MMAITANTCRVCSERFLFGRGQGYAHDLCSLDCERDELNAKAQSLQRRCEAAEALNQKLLDELKCLYEGMLALIEKAEVISPLAPTE
jgi:cell division protein FtsB